MKQRITKAAAFCLAVLLTIAVMSACTAPEQASTTQATTTAATTTTAQATTTAATTTTAKATTTARATSAVPATTQATTAAQAEVRDYVANTNTMKFHYPSCSSVKDIADHNRWNFNGTRNTLISQGYVPCKRCDP